jgi:chemotaxis protein CheD
MKPETVYLGPGEAYLDDRPALVSTVLGSCIAVTMFHRMTRRGRICHAILPRYPSAGQGDTFHYVDSSILHMLENLLFTGLERAEIEVKLFGGANAFKGDDERATVGELNAERAVQVIRKERLTILASDLGGRMGRKIVFDTQSGKVLLKRLNAPPTQDFLPSHTNRKSGL